MGETEQEFEAWQELFRAKLRDVFGFPAVYDSAVEDIDPRRWEHPEVAVRHRSYERWTWSIRTERRFRVPLYPLFPDSVGPPHPVAVALHDHTEHGKGLAAGVAKGEAAGRYITDDRRGMVRQATRRGFTVVAPDMRAFSELSPDASDDSDSSDTVSACTRWQRRAQLLNWSLVGERVRGVHRLVDLVKGYSVLDDRIGHVAVHVSVCPFRGSIVPIDHCLYNYVPDLRCFGETWDIVGPVAPRPLRIIADEFDPIFPIAGMRRTFDRTQGRYRAADARRECSLLVDDGGRRFFEAGAWLFLHDRL